MENQPHHSPPATHRADEIEFVGQLRAVNLDTQRARVTDDVGSRVALPDLQNIVPASQLIGQYVRVTGTAEYNPDGQLTHIHEATVQPTEPLDFGATEPAPFAGILAQAPGPRETGIPDLTDEEADAFLTAIGL